MTNNAVTVKSLLDEAFRVLLPDAGDDEPTHPHMRIALGQAFWRILQGAAPAGAWAILSGWKIEQHPGSAESWVIAEPNGRSHIAADKPASEETERVLARLCKVLAEPATSKPVQCDPEDVEGVLEWLDSQQQGIAVDVTEDGHEITVPTAPAVAARMLRSLLVAQQEQSEAANGLEAER